MSTPLLSALLSAALLELELAAAQSGGGGGGGNTASTVVASEVSTAGSSNATSSVGGWNSAGYGDDSWGQVRQECPLAARARCCCWLQTSNRPSRRRWRRWSAPFPSWAYSSSSGSPAASARCASPTRRVLNPSRAASAARPR